MEMALFWNVALSGRCVRIALMMEAAGISETSVNPLPDYKAQQPKRQPLSYSTPREPEMSLIELSPLGRLGRKWKDNIKVDVRLFMLEMGLNVSAFGLMTEVGFSYVETSGSVVLINFLCNEYVYINYLLR
jgi:hypothetical protein